MIKLKYYELPEDARRQWGQDILSLNNVLLFKEAVEVCVAVTTKQTEHRLPHALQEAKVCGLQPM